MLAFHNIYQLLKPGGQILLCTFEKTPIDPVYEKLDKGIWSKYEHWKVYSTFYKRNAVEEYKKIIEGAGFKDCNVELLPDVCVTFDEKALEGNKHLSKKNFNQKAVYGGKYLFLFCLLCSCLKEK